MTPTAVRQRAARRGPRAARARRGDRSAAPAPRPRGQPRRQVPARGGPHPPHRRAGPRAPPARPAPRRPPPRPAHRHDDLRLPGLAARRPRPGAPAQQRDSASEHHVRHVPGLNEELGATSAWGSQLAAQLPGARYDGVLAHVVRQGARPRPRRRLAAPRQLRRRLRAPAARSPWWATTRAASPPRSRAPRSRCSRACTCRSSSPATCRRCSTSACTPSPARAPRGCGRASRSSPTSPTRSAPPRSRRTAWRRRSPTCGYEHAPQRQPAGAGLARDGAHAAGRAHRAGARLRARERRQPHRGRERRLARDRRAPASPTTTCARPCAASASTTARSSAPACGSSSSGMIWPLEPEIARRFARGLEEILVVEEKGPFLETPAQGAALRHGRRPADRRASATSAASRSWPPTATSTPTLIARAVAARLRARVQLDSVEARLRELAAIEGRPSDAADGAAHPVLLLRLPAQQLDQGPRGHARGRRDRLPHDGPAQPRGQGRDHRHHADGRRGRAVDRHGAVHRRQPPGAEPRRRHLPPLRLARHPGRRRRRREHHLQAALQRARRDDRRPGDRGPAERAGPHPLARARGRAADHRHGGGPEPLQGRRAGAASPRCATAASCSPPSRSWPRSRA